MPRVQEKNKSNVKESLLTWNFGKKTITGGSWVIVPAAMVMIWSLRQRQERKGGMWDEGKKKERVGWGRGKWHRK